MWYVVMDKLDLFVEQYYCWIFAPIFLVGIFMLGFAYACQRLNGVLTDYENLFKIMRGDV